MKLRRPKHRSHLYERELDRETANELRADGLRVRPARPDVVQVAGVRADQFRSGGRRGRGKPRSRRPWRR